MVASQAPSVSADRAGWTARRFRLGEEPGDDLSSSTTVQERLAMMWSLACAAWAASGQTVPAYQRQKAPARVRPLKGSDER